MNYVIFNSDGSIKNVKFTEIIVQGNDGVDEIGVAVEGKSNYVASAYFSLPNGDATQLVGSAFNFNLDGTSYQGYRFVLTNAVTALAGIVGMSIRLTGGSLERQFTVDVDLTINESGYDPTVTDITMEQYENILTAMSSMQQKYVTNNARFYANLDYARADLTNLAYGQTILIADPTKDYQEVSCYYKDGSGNLVFLSKVKGIDPLVLSFQTDEGSSGTITQAVADEIAQAFVMVKEGLYYWLSSVSGNKREFSCVHRDSEYDRTDVYEFDLSELTWNVTRRGTRGLYVYEIDLSASSGTLTDEQAAYLANHQNRIMLKSTQDIYIPTRNVEGTVFEFATIQRGGYLENVVIHTIRFDTAQKTWYKQTNALGIQTLTLNGTSGALTYAQTQFVKQHPELVSVVHQGNVMKLDSWGADSYVYRSATRSDGTFRQATLDTSTTAGSYTVELRYPGPLEVVWDGFSGTVETSYLERFRNAPDSLVIRHQGEVLRLVNSQGDVRYYAVFIPYRAGVKPETNTLATVNLNQNTYEIVSATGGN